MFVCRITINKIELLPHKILVFVKYSSDHINGERQETPVANKSEAKTEDI